MYIYIYVNIYMYSVYIPMSHALPKPPPCLISSACVQVQVFPKERWKTTPGELADPPLYLQSRGSPLRMCRRMCSPKCV